MSIIAFSALLFLTVIVSAQAGKDGHGHGPMGMGMMMGLDKDQKAKMCLPDNMNDAKLEAFKAEVGKCEIDECAKEADDVKDKCEKEDNKRILRMHCSQKFRDCHHKHMEKFRAMKKGEGEGGDKEAMKKKFQEKKACMKAAFDKAYA